ncbi:conserved protein, unknown function [Hepatocystis sp. ex Piliocolobus tephrosceles]|nr:conserved protein, unknown function [Hepatocystis sp. ex Piliocolobus tephrosceles]
MALTTDYSKLEEIIYEPPASPSFYNKSKFTKQKEYNYFYDVKEFMCLGSTVKDSSEYENMKHLKDWKKKCTQNLTETYKMIGYKYNKTNNDDNIKFVKTFYDNYSNLFYCMHLHSDDKKCNNLFKHFYQTINYEQS